jgi:ferrous iron transport protein A
MESSPSLSNVASPRRRATFLAQIRDLAHIARTAQKLSLKTIFKYGTGLKMPKSLAEIPLGKTATISTVDGSRAFRRRLLEMGLVPGVEVRVVTIAPLGDPLRIEVRGGQWSMRRAEAAQIAVEAEERALAPKALLVAVAPTS